MRRWLLLLAVPCLLSVRICFSMAPPHPDRIDESKTRHLRTTHPESITCRNLTACYHELPWRRIAQTTGTIRPLVILVRFQDHADRALPSLDDVEQLFHGTDISELIPTGSMQSYLSSNSYNRFLLEADIMDWTLTDQTESYYSYSQSGLVLATAQSMHVVLDYWESQGIDMAQYDQDGDGVIDALIMLHSGYPAEVGGVDCQTQASELNRIWSHAIGHPTAYSWKSSTSSIQSGPYMIGSAMRGTCGSNLNQIGVLTHEFMHIWGIPDLYDTSGDWIGKGVGSYDLMGNPFGLVGDQTLPSNIGPWTKLQMQWIEPIVIEEDGYYTIEPSATSPQVYKINAGFPSPDEYLLIENRQPIQWDASFTGGGLVIWHIDDAAPGQRRRGYPSQTDWPSNGNHYQVAVLQADGRYDLEQGVNQGDADDFYSYGDELGPAPIESGTVTQAFYPSTNSYYNGQPKQTGIRIYDISPSGTVMSFRVSGITPETDPSSPSPSVTPTLVSTPMPASAQVPTTANQTPPPTLLSTPVPTILSTPAPTSPPIPSPILEQTPPPTSAPVYGQTSSPTPPPIVLQTQIPVDTPVDVPTESATLGPTSGATTALSTTAAPILTTTTAPAAIATTPPTVTSQTTLPASSPTPTASQLPFNNNATIMTLSSAFRLKRTTLLMTIALIFII